MGWRDTKSSVSKTLDFTNEKLSIDIPKTLYHPGTQSLKISDILPKFINNNLKEIFLHFNKQMNGYLTNDAVATPESRTSPVKIISRDKNNYQILRSKDYFHVEARVIEE